MGATRAVNSSVGLFSFEGDGVSLSKKSIIEFDKKGYSCYSTSRAGLFKVCAGFSPYEMNLDTLKYVKRRQEMPTSYLVLCAWTRISVLALDYLSHPIIRPPLFLTCLTYCAACTFPLVSRLFFSSLVLSSIFADAC